MTEQTSSETSLGVASVRKPSRALNLSLCIPGLGQIYCGVLRWGLIQLCIASGLVALAMLAIATGWGNPFTMCVLLVIALTALAIYSGFDARRLALQTREDYRLKEYNNVGVYTALTGLFLVMAVGLALVIRSNFLAAFVMAGGSMAPTLPDGSKVLVRKDTYRGTDPARNELVAFLNPSDRRQTWVKRVIGLPGDEVSLRSGVVHINGKPVEDVSSVDRDQADFAATVVPENHCFLLGDNRAKSKDSRYIGPVPMIALVGKVIYPN